MIQAERIGVLSMICTKEQLSFRISLAPAFNGHLRAIRYGEGDDARFLKNLTVTISLDQMLTGWI